ncbi:hypothetical protein CFBP5877_00315 [Agrobacterium tumefaciens]|uniref:Uncharacterized protein n=2 Tax=Rhizobium/Agrobacterium group TaxID=227290 RepID=A0AAE6BCZ4_AGRTU|nr:hypothetical protein CFBP5499_00315 [Agrobacterium tumefaciens]QCL80167.1 hypothetical protein CFBP5877_00315 [Agrobacterium tumefaciens]
MGSWHNFSRHKIYQCCVKKEFRILSIAHENRPLPAIGEGQGGVFSVKGEVLKPLRQLTLLGLCPYKPRTLGHRKLAQAGLAVQKTKRSCK